MRIGARYNINCSRVSALNGGEITWSNDIRYLGVQITAGNKFCCFLGNAKRSFYRGFNCIFGRVGRIASEHVVIELLKAKCLPGLYYGLETCPLNKSQIRSLEYILNNAFRNILVIFVWSCIWVCSIVLLFSLRCYIQEENEISNQVTPFWQYCVYIFTDIINRELSSLDPNVT